MVAFELVRLVLFAMESTLSIIAVAVFPSQLYRTTLDAARTQVCAIGSVGFCRFGIAWTLAATLLLALAVAWHLSGTASPPFPRADPSGLHVPLLTGPLSSRLLRVLHAVRAAGAGRDVDSFWSSGVVAGGRNIVQRGAREPGDRRRDERRAQGRARRVVVARAAVCSVCCERVAHRETRRWRLRPVRHRAAAVRARAI
jgi:hypothetical protein